MDINKLITQFPLEDQKSLPQQRTRGSFQKLQGSLGIPWTLGRQRLYLRRFIP